MAIANVVAVVYAYYTQQALVQPVWALRTFAYYNTRGYTLRSLAKRLSRSAARPEIRGGYEYSRHLRDNRPGKFVEMIQHYSFNGRARD